MDVFACFLIAESKGDNYRICLCTHLTILLLLFKEVLWHLRMSSPIYYQSEVIGAPVLCVATTKLEL